MERAKSVCRRDDAGFLLLYVGTSSSVPRRNTGEAPEGRVEVGANVGLSDTRSVYIDLRQAVHRCHLQSAWRVGIYQYTG